MAVEPLRSPLRRGFGVPWLLLCLAFTLHVWDEAAHDFLSYYNATVLTLYGHFSWFPRVDLTYHAWWTSMAVTIAVCSALSPFAFRNAPWLRPFAYLFAFLLFLNGIAHTASEIRGGTVPSVRFAGIAPGFYTAPLLMMASAYLLWRLRKTAHPQATPPAKSRS
jgi:hypothetical protein